MWLQECGKFQALTESRELSLRENNNGIIHNLWIMFIGNYHHAVVSSTRQYWLKRFIIHAVYHWNRFDSRVRTSSWDGSQMSRNRNNYVFSIFFFNQQDNRTFFQFKTDSIFTERRQNNKLSYVVGYNVIAFLLSSYYSARRLTTKLKIYLHHLFTTKVYKFISITDGKW